jgi:uncharacterized RDD family membrane protein YckC
VRQHVTYAGFWQRLAAYFIDTFPIFLLNALVFYFFLGFDRTVQTYFRDPGNPELSVAFMRERDHIRDVSLTMWLVYCTLMEASRFQGTLGKRLMGIRVVHENGNRLSLARAAGRNCGKILSALPLFLGFMWIGWSGTKQGWHDAMSGCFIVKTSERNNADK